MTAPAIAPPTTLRLSAFLSPGTWRRSRSDVIATSPSMLVGSSLIKIERTRSPICAVSGLSPGPTDVTSRTTVVPSGIVAPFSPTTDDVTVAVILSPGRFVVHTADFVTRPKVVPARNPGARCSAGAGARAGCSAVCVGSTRVGTRRTGCGCGRRGEGVGRAVGVRIGVRAGVTARFSGADAIAVS